MAAGSASQDVCDWQGIEECYFHVKAQAVEDFCLGIWSSVRS